MHHWTLHDYFFLLDYDHLLLLTSRSRGVLRLVVRVVWTILSPFMFDQCCFGFSVRVLFCHSNVQLFLFNNLFNFKTQSNSAVGTAFHLCCDLMTALWTFEGLNELLLLLLRLFLNNIDVL